MNRTMPRTWMTAWWWLLLAGLLAASAASAAGPQKPVSAADMQKVRGVIQAQLDALAADDAKRAFSFASPGIQKQVGTADDFIGMVRASYPVVYRPASVVFLAPQWIDGILVQGVQMTDAAGSPWLAVYTMERQKSGLWRISGCSVRANEGRAT